MPALSEAAPALPTSPPWGSLGRPFDKEAIGGSPERDPVPRGYAAFQRGDIEALRNDYFTEDVVWHSPGKNPLSATTGASTR
jgi:hypothetical protein